MRLWLLLLDLILGNLPCAHSTTFKLRSPFLFAGDRYTVVSDFIEIARAPMRTRFVHLVNSLPVSGCVSFAVAAFMLLLVAFAALRSIAR